MDKCVTQTRGSNSKLFYFAFLNRNYCSLWQPWPDVNSGQWRARWRHWTVFGNERNFWNSHDD